MSVKNVTVRQAHDSQAAGSTYVDVRSIPRLAMGHPAGAMNVPLLHHSYWTLAARARREQ